MLHTLLDALDRMWRVILFDVAVLHAGAVRRADDWLHRDRAVAEFLECFLWN